MKIKRLRKIAERCRDLLRVARRPDVREQLREWVKEAESEADRRRRTRRRTGQLVA